MMFQSDVILNISLTCFHVDEPEMNEIELIASAMCLQSPIIFTGFIARCNIIAVLTNHMFEALMRKVIKSNEVRKCSYIIMSLSTMMSIALSPLYDLLADVPRAVHHGGYVRFLMPTQGL